jgi:MoaA/NifB/PqqE/SkfB family radical SAM enzyme
MDSPSAEPEVVLWEMTYACPLRCIHCNTDSGRRPARQLPLDEMLRLADVLIAMKPRVVHLSGGEPLVIPGLPKVLQRLHDGGMSVVLSSSGFGATPELVGELARRCHSVHISVDGPDAEIHDRVRARAGSFAAAMEALTLLSQQKIRFGIDCTLVRANFDHMERILREVAPRFVGLEFALFNCAVPTGAAGRDGFSAELLDDAQIAALNGERLFETLQAAAPPGVVVALTDNAALQMRPHDIASGTAANSFLCVEPDGMVRALPIYEGVVGNLLVEPPAVLWQRVLARRQHPFVVAELAEMDTMARWATATRRINEHFATPSELVRLRARERYQ